MPQTPTSPDQLETELNIKIPPVDKIDWNTIGYTVDTNGQINGLCLYGCKVTTEHLEIINNLTSLTKLYLGDNQITEIKNLEKLTSLTKLSLSQNQITKIENLNSLRGLKKILLSANHIKKIDSLKNLTNLKS